MNRKQGVTILLLALIVASNVVPLTVFVPASQAAMISDYTIAADGETMTVTVSVMEDETVLNIEPDHNFDGEYYMGGLFVGMETDDGALGRSWLKFDLQHLPRGISINTATLHVFLNDEYTYEDAAIGAYYSANDTWSSDTITWNNQPYMAGSPSDVIDSPASPDMFVAQNWYSWDVTSPVQWTFSGDGILTEVLKAVDESASESHSFEYFTESEYGYLNYSYLTIEYTTPILDSLQVNGWSSAPQIDYIPNSEPTLSWQFSDDDTGDYQKQYEVDVRTGAAGTGSSVYHAGQTDVETVYDSASPLNYRPFHSAGENRYQMKIDSSMIPRDGILDKIYIQCNNTSGELILENLEVRMLAITSIDDLSADFAANYEGRVPVCVLSGEAVHVPIVNSWIVFDLENTFMVSDVVDLLVEFRFTDNLGVMTLINYTNLADNSVAYSYGAGAYCDIIANQLYSRTHNIKFEYASVEVYSAGTLSNAYPFAQTEARMQFKYNRSMIGREGFIDRIFFGVAALTSDIILESLSIYLAETPLQGYLTRNFQDNYGGVTPTLVFQNYWYTLTNMGRWLIFDVDDTFYYNNEHDLLVEIVFEGRTGSGLNCRYTSNMGGYRAYNITDSQSPIGGNSSSTYEFSVEFINSEQSTTIESPSPLVNGTQYYYRVRACDSLGIWTTWHELPFKYNDILGIPTWSNLVVNPSTARVGDPVTVSIDVQYFLGINEVSLEFGGTNHTMSNDGDTYSYTWTPSTPGTVDFTIYMESYTGDFGIETGSFVVAQSIIPGIDDTILIIAIAVVALVLVVSTVAYMRKRRPSKTTKKKRK